MTDCFYKQILDCVEVFSSGTTLLSAPPLPSLQPSYLLYFVYPSQTLRPGDGPSSRPTPQSRVKMKTKGVLDEGGQVVDRHSGVRFTVGDGDVIQGKVVVCV